MFVLTILAAILQIPQFTTFIIGDKCDFLGPFLQKISPELNGDAKCFDVVATLENGCWVLFAACFMQLLVGSVVRRTCHSMLEQRTAPFVDDQRDPKGENTILVKYLPCCISQISGYANI